MKKLIITIAIVLGMGLTTFAHDDAHGGGLFQRGSIENNSHGFYLDRNGGLLSPDLPAHGLTGNQDAPIGTGIAVLLGLGAAYLVGKKRKEG